MIPKIYNFDFFTLFPEHCVVKIVSIWHKPSAQIFVVGLAPKISLASHNASAESTSSLSIVYRNFLLPQL